MRASFASSRCAADPTTSMDGAGIEDSQSPQIADAGQGTLGIAAVQPVAVVAAARPASTRRLRHPRQGRTGAGRCRPRAPRPRRPPSVAADDRAHVERVADTVDARRTRARLGARSVTTSRASVAGRSRRPVSAGTARWPAITTRAPAAIAARNGTSSRASSSSAGPLDQPAVRDGNRRSARRARAGA